MPNTLVASVLADSELMWNVLPAVALPAHSKFLTARDRNGNPMVFGIGSDNLFRVAQDNPTTRIRDLIVLNTRLGFPETAKVLAFDIVQASDDTIYLSIAIDDNGQHRLLAIEPFSPSSIDFTAAASTLKAIECPRLDDVQIKDVLLGEIQTGKAFPAIILNYFNTSLRSANVKHFETADNSFDELENRGDLSLPVDTKNIICYATGKVSGRKIVHHGVFALYKQGGVSGLIFSSYSDQFDSTCICPPSANYVSTFHNSKGDTDVLLGGDGFWHFAAKDFLTSDAQGTLLCEGPFFKGISDMHVAQNGSQVCAYGSTRDNGVSYLEFSTSAIPSALGKDEQRGVPLIPSGQGGGLAGFLGRDRRNALLVSNIKNDMTFLEQAPDTRLWKQTPFWFPSPDNTLKIYSYMTRIRIVDQNDDPVPYAVVDVASTGWVDVIINGTPSSLGSSVTAITSDVEGSINIINPTTDLSGYSFTVSGIRNATGNDSIYTSKPVNINPMSKVEQALSSMTAEKLGAAKLSDGTPVFSNSTPDQLKDAASALAEIDTARSSLTAVDSTRPLSGVPTPEKAMTMSISSTSSSLGSKVVNAFWDFWHFVEQTYEKAKNWVIETYNGMKAFVIKLGENAYRFVLDTVERIAKAASFIYDKYLKAPLEKIVDWLKMFFSWGDIVETKNNIVDFINGMFDYADNNLSWGSDQVNSKFDQWNALIKDKLAPKNVPDAIKKKQTAPKTANNVDAGTKKKLNDSEVKSNWTKYQLSHGGALKGAMIVDAGGVVVDEFKKTWDDIIQPVFASLQESTDTISQSLVLLFKDSPDFTVKDVLQKIGVDVLVGFLDAVKSLISGALKRMARLFSDTKALLNKQIRVPIFSELWELANKVFDKNAPVPTFSVIGFVGFILAIPITQICKLFTGAKPRSPAKMNALSLEKFFNGSASPEDKLSYNGLAAMIEGTAGSTLAIIGFATVAGVGAGALLAKLFDFQLIFGLVRVMACWPSRKDLPGWELRVAVWAVDLTNVLVLAISRKVDTGGQSEKVLAGIECGTAILNIGLHTAVNSMELIEDWKDKDEERTGYQILISVLGGASTIGKDVATIASDPYVKLGGVVVKQVAGKSSGLFNIVNTYGNISKGKYVAILNSGS